MNEQITTGEPVLVGAYVDPAMKRRLVEQARRSDRSVSAELRVALRTHLDRDRPDSARQKENLTR